MMFSMLKKKGLRQKVVQLLIIALGSVIYAVGISLFLDPNRLAPGGITGIAVILNRLAGVETGTLYFLLNVPIILLGIWKFGIRFIARTIYAIALISFCSNLLAAVGPLTDDLLMAGAIGSTLGVLHKWTAEDFATPTEHVAELLSRIFLSGILPFISGNVKKEN